MRGFEPPAPASRRQCSTRLSYIPIHVRVVRRRIISIFLGCGKRGHGWLSAAHNLSSSVAHKLSGLKITREVIRDETNDSVTGGQEDEI